MKYISPQGEVIEVAAAGGHALLALGWKPLEEPKPRRRNTKTEPTE